MIRNILIIGLMVIAAQCLAGDYQMFTVTTHATTSSVAMTKYADPFTGDIDEIAVYTPSGVTGAVAVAAIDSYSDGALVLGTNAAVTGYMVFRPRIMEPAISGASSLVVTNAASADRFRAQGERIRAIVSSASTSNAVFRFRIKIK